MSKEERKRVCKLIDSRKLSAEASIHAAQNERLPVRAVIQVLLSEQTKLSKLHLDWSGSFSFSASGTRSPAAAGLQDPSARCMSKRDMNTINIQQLEIKKLKEELLRLQTQCMNMQGQIEKLLERKRSGFFSWKKFGQLPSLPLPLNKGITKLGASEVDVEGELAIGFGRQTPMAMDMKARLVRGRTSTKWRKSLS